jgi:hypothetical protein
MRVKGVDEVKQDVTEERVDVFGLLFECVDHDIVEDLVDTLADDQERVTRDNQLVDDLQSIDLYEVMVRVLEEEEDHRLC